MRHLLQLFVLVGLLGGTVGCNLMTGVCDCEPHACGNVPGFAGCAGCGAQAAPRADGVKVEGVKEMQKLP